MENQEKNSGAVHYGRTSIRRVVTTTIEAHRLPKSPSIDEPQER